MTTRLMAAGVLAAALAVHDAVIAGQATPSQPAATTPQSAPAPARPSTDVFVAPLKVSGATVTVGAPVNISSSPGYDNQPSFTPDGASLLFTSVRGDAKQSEIYRYDFGASAGTLTRLTETAESEYSPTVTPDGRHFSVIRVEADGTQRLWQFTMGGKTPSLVLTDVKPVGYHAWTDDRTLALFVLGKPATLQIADSTTGAAAIAATDIGRSIQRIPGRNTVSFVLRETPASGGGAATLTVREIDPKTRAITTLVPVVSGATEADLAWTPDGLLLMAHNGALYGWRRGDATWSRLADLDALGLSGVSRMAVSPKGDRIAFVANQKP